MKKNLFALLMAMVMMLTLVACGSKEEPKEEIKEEETTTEDVVIELEVADPGAGTPAAPTEEPNVEPEMPTVGEETPEAVRS